MDAYMFRDQEDGWWFWVRDVQHNDVRYWLCMGSGPSLSSRYELAPWSDEAELDVDEAFPPVEDGVTILRFLQGDDVDSVVEFLLGAD